MSTSLISLRHTEKNEIENEKDKKKQQTPQSVFESELLSNNILDTDKLLNDLNKQLNSTKSELSRVYSCLSEKDMKLKKLQLINNERLDNGHLSNVTDETVGLKIVDMAKRIRQLNSLVEIEKSKYSHSERRIKKLENQLNKPTVKKEDDKKTINHVSCKCKFYETKIVDLNNHIIALKNDIRKAHAVLKNEIGTEVDINELLTKPIGSKSRSQQIIALQGKVGSLQDQLTLSNCACKQSTDIEPYLDSNKTDNKNGAKEYIKKLEYTRSQHVDKILKSNQDLSKENNVLKQKLEAFKCRIKVINTNLKCNKIESESMRDLLENEKRVNESLKIQLKSKKTIQSNDTTSNESYGLQQKFLVHSEIKNLHNKLIEKEIEIKKLKKNIFEINNLKSEDNKCLEKITYQNQIVSNELNSNFNNIHQLKSVEMENINLLTELASEKTINKYNLVKFNSCQKLVEILQKRIEQDEEKYENLKKNYYDSKNKCFDSNKSNERIDKKMNFKILKSELENKIKEIEILKNEKATLISERQIYFENYQSSLEEAKSVFLDGINIYKLQKIKKLNN